jgi:hypothetical protein
MHGQFFKYSIFFLVQETIKIMSDLKIENLQSIV